MYKVINEANTVRDAFRGLVGHESGAESNPG